MSADGLKVVEWYVHASFAVHPDLKSHTGAIMNMVLQPVLLGSSNLADNTSTI